MYVPLSLQLSYVVMKLVALRYRLEVAGSASDGVIGIIL